MPFKPAWIPCLIPSVADATMFKSFEPDWAFDSELESSDPILVLDSDDSISFSAGGTLFGKAFDLALEALDLCLGTCSCSGSSPNLLLLRRVPSDSTLEWESLR